MTVSRAERSEPPTTSQTGDQKSPSVREDREPSSEDGLEFPPRIYKALGKMLVSKCERLGIVWVLY